MPNPRLLISSLVFFTNTVMTFFKEKWMYSFLFGSLTVTSIFFHYSPHMYSRVADKLALFSVVAYGAYELYTKPIEIHVYLLIVSSFILCILLFYYGHLTKQYCYDPDPEIGDLYHILLHLISSMGHHAILFL